MGDEAEMTLKERARSFARMYEWKRDYPVVYHEKPTQIYIEPTNHCNLKCVMCPHHDGLTRAKGFMDIGFYHSLIDQISQWGVRQVSLFYGGESFLHKEIFEMIDYAKWRGLYTRIHTNGLVLDQAACEKIIISGLDELSFSVDGLSKASYEAFRSPGKYERAISCVRTFLTAKQESQQGPKTLIQCILLDETPVGMLQARAEDAFKGLPYDQIVFRLPHSWAGTVPVTRPNSKTKLDIEYKYEYSPCPQPWDRLIVGWDGMVFPCCQDLNGSLVVGYAKKETLQAIWNGLPMRELRRSFKSKANLYSLCAKCEVPYASRPMPPTLLNKAKYAVAKILKESL